MTAITLATEDLEVTSFETQVPTATAPGPVRAVCTGDLTTCGETTPEAGCLCTQEYSTCSTFEDDCICTSDISTCSRTSPEAGCL